MASRLLRLIGLQLQCSIYQLFWRARARIFFRRHQRGHHHRTVEAAMVLCDRPQLLLRLQGKGGAFEADRRGTRRRLCRRGLRAQAGEHIRITAQLNDVSTGSHLWAERYDRNLADVFAVQDGITQAVVAAIQPQLYAAEDFQPAAKRQTIWTPGIWSCEHCSTIGG